MNSRVHQWSIEKIEAFQWRVPGKEVQVWASNWAGDEIDFCVTWHPDDYAIYYEISQNFISEDLFPYQAEEIVKSQLFDEAVETLDDWWAQVQDLANDLNPSRWKLARGIAAPDVYYAKCALLYSIRAQYYPLKVVKLLADDMSVPESTVKERLRKAKEKGFLTNPGKGLNGQGLVTNKAINLIKKEGK